MDKIPFEDGTKLKSATVTVNEQEYEVTPAQYEGKTPLSALNLNKMQSNIENTLVKVSSTEPNPKSDIWFQHGDNVTDDILINDSGIYNSIFSKNNIIWQGEIYQSGTKITLNRTLKHGKAYTIKFLGLSSTYYVYYTFVYDNNFIQYSYYDPTRNGFRYRLDISENGSVIIINSDSINNTTNSKIVAIYEIN